MNSENENQQEEIHRKIGRNLVLFQRVELLLKKLIFKGNLTLQINHRNHQFPSLEEQAKRQRGSVMTNTLGTLVKKFSQSILRPLPDSSVNKNNSEPISSFRINMSHGMTEHGTTEYQDQFKEKLELVTSGRNKLVHELFASFDLSTNDGLEELDIFLEKQHKFLLPLVDEFESMDESWSKSAKILLESSLVAKIPEDCGKLLCATKLVVCLSLFEDDISKTCGVEWISLASAKKYLNNLFPEAIPECRRHYNVKSLKKIVRKIGVFDVQRLRATHGKEMVFYRMKHEYSLQQNESGELHLCSLVAAESGGYMEEKVSLGMYLEK